MMLAFILHVLAVLLALYAALHPMARRWHHRNHEMLHVVWWTAGSVAILAGGVALWMVGDLVAQYVAFGLPR